MQEYIDRLIRCGFSAHCAWRVCDDFMRDYDVAALNDYIQAIEAATYVG